MTVLSHKTPVCTRHMSKVYAILERGIRIVYSYDALEIHTMPGSNGVVALSADHSNA